MENLQSDHKPLTALLYLSASLHLIIYAPHYSPACLKPASHGFIQSVKVEKAVQRYKKSLKYLL